MCKAQANLEARGKGLAPEDRGELIEACMLGHGWALKEDEPHCTDSEATANDLRCYYPNNFIGRLYAGAGGG